MALLDDAATWLPDQVQIAAGKTATYTRRAPAISGSVTVVVGQVAFPLTVSGGARVEVSDRDFMILVSDLTALGITKPQRGDRIQLSGDSEKYEIIDTNTGEAPVRFTDATETEWRIHAKRVV